MIFESLIKIEEINPIIYKMRYVYGIPNIDNPCHVKLEPIKDGIIFQNADTNNTTFYELKRSQIKNISVEDESTIEKRVGFRRMLLVGIFAFAWKKRQVNPMSFFIIEYKDDLGLDQEMCIQSEHKEGLQTFNNLKYNIYKFWKDVDENPDYEKSLIETKEKHRKITDQRNKDSMNGCLFIIAAIIIIFGIVYACS